MLGHYVMNACGVPIQWLPAMLAEASLCKEHLTEFAAFLFVVGFLSVVFERKGIRREVDVKATDFDADTLVYLAN